jgi:CubicO group peptidase (beta-lactamase class C family)
VFDKIGTLGKTRLAQFIRIFICFAFILPSLLLFQCITAGSSLEERIQRVDNGLINAVLIKGQPVEKWNIVDRMKHYKVPGVSIAVINNYKIEWAKGYGVKEVGKEDVVTLDTLFQAASISKPVAASAALHFVEEGVLDLDENVNNKLDSWRIPDNKYTEEEKVTLRRLLSHSSGLTVHGFRGYAQGEEIPTVLQVLDGEEPANSDPVRVDIEPGSQSRYSGGGFTVMQYMLTELKNKPFPQIMRETVLDPLNMRLSTYEQPLPENRRGEEAIAYRSNGKPIEGKWHTYPEMAAAGLWTTPSDLCRFAIELMLSVKGKPNKTLSKEMVSQMLSVQKGNYGLGIGLGEKGENFSFSHGGGNEGFKCYLVAYPEKGQGVAIMTNSDNGSKLYIEILTSIANEYVWNAFQPEEKALAEVDPSIYDQYTGKYMLSPGVTVTVSKENNRLYVQVPGEDPEEFFPESETDFFSIEMDFQITFVKNEEGAIEKIVANYQGQKLELKKIE